LGKVIELKLFQQDFSKTPLTLEQGMKLLGLKKWPEEWELWKVGIFLGGLTSIVKREGEAWVRFHRESILTELEQIMTF
jgi:hypothetical protein